ncbi:hypothetical protein Taro_014913 [Colocasia esculenta]|uniref:TOD1/MUCI70 glycosyltransferase-like domain-containing protein n=1 Tax=Colocasia esculenta TaxID=4460 RepID=A0A843UGC0_COLES|nr:hypothetical protein [Colocasia esculenta]
MLMRARDCSSDMQGRSDEEQEPGNETRQDDFFGFRPRTNRSVVSKQLRFGKGSVAVGRDSRYWDRDDRRRDDEYGEDSPDSSDNGGNATDDHLPEDEERRRRAEQLTSGNGRTGESDQERSKTRGLYNEAGRTELKEYEEKYEESLQKSEQPGGEGSRGEEVDSSEEYDDGFGIEDASMDDSNDLELGNGDHIEGVVRRDSGTGQTISSREQSKGTRKAKMKRSTHTVFAESGGNGKTEHGLSGVGLTKSSSSAKKKTGAKGNSKRHKFSGCEIKFLNSTDLLLEPLESKKFSRFSLHYSEAEDRPGGVENWEPRFAGHQTLQEREESFYARDQKINCGFVKGPEGSSSTGFDLAEDDVKYMSSCHIVVSSCIFGNSDHLKTPGSKTVKRPSRKNVCFVMFVDEDTLQTLSAEGQKPDSMGFVGLWKIIVAKNLPYTDMRRVGKIPKFLTHRLFPSARYSIWLDSKLRLTSDPQLLLEYFLWRKGFEYAISNHYDRHCVWEEVMQNKKLNKFNHTIIDEQFMFYQADGLTRFDPSDPNTLLPSCMKPVKLFRLLEYSCNAALIMLTFSSLLLLVLDVPEGSFILRAHTPMSNLFSCLWFNEVDRFTPRDQLSFAYTYLKLRRMNPEKPFHLNMFKDCERRAIAKLYRHRIQNSPLSTVG